MYIAIQYWIFNFRCMSSQLGQRSNLPPRAIVFSWLLFSLFSFFKKDFGRAKCEGEFAG